jgi:hypothetical protein
MSDVTADERFRGWVKALSEFWDLHSGALMRLRAGDLDISGVRGFVEVLTSIEISDHDCIPRRLVSLLWFVPTYMLWQVERVEERGGDLVQLRVLAQETHRELERVLGSPCGGDSRPPGQSASSMRGFDQWIGELDMLWRDPNVGLCRVKDGIFRSAQTTRIVSLLAAIDGESVVCFPRRFVTLVWDMPGYLERNVERVIEGGGSAERLRRDAVRIRNELERLLGAP